MDELGTLARWWRLAAMSCSSEARAASPAPLVLVIRAGPPWYGAMWANTLTGVTHAARRIGRLNS